MNNRRVNEAPDWLVNTFIVLMIITYGLFHIVTIMSATIFVWTAITHIFNPENLTIYQVVSPLYFLGFAIVGRFVTTTVIKFGNNVIGKNEEYK